MSLLSDTVRWERSTSLGLITAECSLIDEIRIVPIITYVYIMQL